MEEVHALHVAKNVFLYIMIISLGPLAKIERSSETSFCIGVDFGILPRTQALIEAHTKGVPVLQALLSKKNGLGRGMQRVSAH